ncbi:MAG TPA: hypothetical protein VGL12_10610 [Roseiarcus sp.]|jgi:hypothetical protein
MPDRRCDAFQRALDEVGRKDRAPNGDGPGATGSPRVRGVAFARAPGSGGKAGFGLALDWTDEPESRPAPPQPPLREPIGRSGDTPIEIAAELGLDAPLTLDQLTSRWRAFVWRNHPDRQPPEARERANTRMAIANTLYDRARREFARAR